ncbi:MAG: hypothetical protein Q9181_000387 [Wetmoreana brouardii]
MPPLQTTRRSSAEKEKMRPTTTFDSFPGASTIEDDDKTLVSQKQTSNRARLPKHRPRSPDVLRRSSPEDNLKASRNGTTEDHDVISAERALKGSPQPQRRERSRLEVRHANRARADLGERARMEKDGFVAENNLRSTTLPTRPTVSPKKSFTRRIAGLMSQPQSAAEAKAQLKQMISHPIPIEAEAPPPVAQFDAPKSAVNAGERTVRVKYKDFRVPVTVIPSTTPVDIVRAVADKVAISIHQDSAVVLESFKQLGLERPLRKYEHIRDVLNSWDADAQNTLIIEPSATSGQDDDLDMKHAPRKQPDDSSFHLYHSQRPGHWEKRVVTLRSDGQMLIAKSSGAETSNICHLSDFDIYIPTARQVAKKIRPPKRVCFAVKSQQKSNMFMSTVNFVHFFCSNDKDLTRSLYTAVQAWRSWYLVNKMGKGVIDPSQSLIGRRDPAVTAANTSRRPGDSLQTPQGLDPAPKTQTIPLNKPLEMSNTPAVQQKQRSASQISQSTPRNMPPRGHNDRQAPPISYPTTHSVVTAAETPFTGGGLLGRTYTQRKKAMQTNEARYSDTHPPIIPASSPSPAKSDPNPNNGLKRTSSQRQKPKPLVDLTPAYQEPPQHVRKGRGVTPGQIPAGGLVDIATSPEVAIPIPPTTSWRREGMRGGQESEPSRNRSHS